VINDIEYQQCELEMGEMAPSQFLDQSIKLWEGLSTELICVIGDGGFRMLFARSVSLANIRFPWLENFRFPYEGESLFLHFKSCFIGRKVEEMRDANALILSSFIETLSSLIGDTLTTNILRPAWEQRRPANVAAGIHHTQRNLELVEKR